MSTYEKSIEYEQPDPPVDIPEEPQPPTPGGPPPPEWRYTRDAAFDKRDDRLEAWRDQFGLVRWVAVGIDPNRS